MKKYPILSINVNNVSMELLNGVVTLSETFNFCETIDEVDNEEIDKHELV